MNGSTDYLHRLKGIKFVLWINFRIFIARFIQKHMYQRFQHTSSVYGSGNKIVMILFLWNSHLYWGFDVSYLLRAYIGELVLTGIERDEFSVLIKTKKKSLPNQSKANSFFLKQNYLFLDNFHFPGEKKRKHYGDFF